MVLFFIIFLILFIVVGVFLLNNSIAINNMLWHFKHCNVINYGAKGTGKDLVTDYVIRKRKDYYYCNIDHSLNNKIPREIIGLHDVSVYPNTYLHFINQEYAIIQRRFYDGKDIYISDVGNFLPSSMDSTLHKLFPSMPLLYSLSRHFYGNNIHCNSQNIERSWKALREQADFFVWSRRTYKIFGILITKCISYDRYDSALAKLLPVKNRIMNKFSKANNDIYRATNGDIRQFYIIQRAKKVSYDTRTFEKFVFDSPRLYYDKKHPCPSITLENTIANKNNDDQ